MKRDDFVRGREVAFDDLRVGEWYFLPRGLLFTVLAPSVLAKGRSWVIEMQGQGAQNLYRNKHTRYTEAVPKPKVELRRNTMDFYFCSDGQVYAGAAGWLFSSYPSTVEKVATATVEVGSDGSVRIVHPEESAK